MINVGIIGGETQAAGELIRILLNHPDVFLRQVCSTEHVGERLDRYHRGLTGDTDLCFTRELTDPHINCVFLVGEPWQAQEYVEKLGDVAVSKGDSDEESDSLLHIIDMTGRYRDGSAAMVYGFAENRRKAMVRGALRASIPSAEALAIELALFPIAKNHLLRGDVNATFECFGAAPTADGEKSGRTYWAGSADPRLSTRLDPIAPIENRPDIEHAADEALRELREIDGGSNSAINVSQTYNPESHRGLKLTAYVPCGVNVEEVKRLYEEAYVDHGFTFLIDREPSVLDISNTNKCLISIEPQNTGMISGSMPGLKITAVMDNLVKGAAGNAVHCMNLLFGLSERTGLALKASTV